MSKIKNLTVFSIGDFLGSAISAGFWLILASMVLPEDFGEIHYLIGIAGIGYAISLIGTSEVLSVYISKKIEVKKTLTVFSLIVGIIVSTIIAILFSRIELGLLIIGYIINDVAIGYILGRKKFAEYSKNILLQRSLTFVLGILFYFIFGPEGIIYALGLSYMHFSIIIFKILKKSKINFPLFKNHIGFIGTNYAMSISGLFRTQLDKIILMPIIGFDVLGNYALALQAYGILMIISNIFYKFILPHDASNQNVKNLKFLMILISIGITLSGVIIGPSILEYIFPKFATVGSAIQILSLAVLPATITLLFTSKFLSNENSKIILSGRIIITSSMIILLLILSPIYGLIGATSAFVISSIISASFFFGIFVYEKRKNNTSA